MPNVTASEPRQDELRAIETSLFGGAGSELRAELRRERAQRARRIVLAAFIAIFPISFLVSFALIDIFDGTETMLLDIDAATAVVRSDTREAPLRQAVARLHQFADGNLRLLLGEAHRGGADSERAGDYLMSSCTLVVARLTTLSGHPSSTVSQEMARVTSYVESILQGASYNSPALTAHFGIHAEGLDRNYAQFQVAFGGLVEAARLEGNPGMHAALYICNLARLAAECQQELADQDRPPLHPANRRLYGLTLNLIK
ncbi:MAG: hypothetical protein AAF628_10240 [Planctomycetota bacterium]